MTAVILFRDVTQSRHAAWSVQRFPIGYIAGTLPYGTVTVNGAPASREVECRHRLTRTVISRSFAADDGSYRFHSLPVADEFDLIGRDFSGAYNDTIVSRIKPEPYDITTLTDETVANGGTGALDGFVRVYGGMPGHTVAVSAGTAPPGITFAVNIIQDNDGAATFAVVPSGSTTPDTYTWTLTVTAPNGSAKSIELIKTIS